ncbi:MAG: hypothetical protein ACTSYT_00620 [Candidatus Asgardarchaeia archaeon]
MKNVYDKILKMFEEPKEDEMVLLEETVIKDVKCGKCGNHLYLRTYFKDGSYYRMVLCKTCGLKMWKR